MIINTLYVAAILFSRSTLHRETLPNITQHCLASDCITSYIASARAIFECWQLNMNITLL